MPGKGFMQGKRGIGDKRTIQRARGVPDDSNDAPNPMAVFPIAETSGGIAGHTCLGNPAPGSNLSRSVRRRTA